MKTYSLISADGSVMSFFNVEDAVQMVYVNEMPDVHDEKWIKKNMPIQEARDLWNKRLKEGFEPAGTGQCIARAIHFRFHERRR